MAATCATQGLVQPGSALVCHVARVAGVATDVLQMDSALAATSSLSKGSIRNVSDPATEPSVVFARSVPVGCMAWIQTHRLREGHQAPVAPCRRL